jgi:hypothetical protein
MDVGATQMKINQSTGEILWLTFFCVVETSSVDAEKSYELMQEIE